MNNLIIPSEFLPIGHPKIYMYELIDPTTGEICYIGQTSNPEKRIVQHCNRPGDIKGNVFMCLWILSLDKVGLKPIMKIIDTALVYRGEADKREKELIHKYWNEGHPLLNGGLRKKNIKLWRDRLNNSQWNILRREVEYFF